MWKLLVAAVLIVSLGEAQRSSYAPRPSSISKLLPRFRQNQTTTEASLGTREGEENLNIVPVSTFQGTLEEERFVQRVSQWPEDRQPFWFKNRYAISSMRGREVDGGNPNRPPSGNNQWPQPQFQSSFQRPTSSRNSLNLVHPDSGNPYINPVPLFLHPYRYQLQKHRTVPSKNP